MEDILVVTLLVIAIFLYKYLKDIFCPPLAFCYSFLGAAISTASSATAWNYTMSSKAYFVIVVGVLSFSLAYIFVFNKKNKSGCSKFYGVLEAKPKSKVIWWIFTMIQIAYCYTFYKFVIGASSVFSNVSLSESLYYYRIEQFSDSSLMIPDYINELKILSMCIAMVSTYIMINNYILKKKIEKKYIINMTLYIIASSFSGARGEIVMFLIAVLIMLYILILKSKNWSIHVNSVKVVKSIIVLFALLICLPYSAILMGRNVDFDSEYGMDNMFYYAWEYLSGYTGGNLVNLDYLIEKCDSGIDSPFFGFYTFEDFFKALERRFNIGIGDLDTSVIHSFNYSNGHSLGNVYTTFSNFYIDGGFCGIIIFSAIMGMIWAFLYRKIKYSGLRSVESSNIYFFLYVQYYFTIVLSFFSNWFYAYIPWVVIKTAFHLWLINKLYFYVDFRVR